MAAALEELSMRLRCKTSGGESEIQPMDDESREGSHFKNSD